MFFLICSLSSSLSLSLTWTKFMVLVRLFFFFFLNNQISQSISLVNKVLKLFSNLTNRVQRTRFCSLKSSQAESSFSWKSSFSHLSFRGRNLDPTQTQSKAETNFLHEPRSHALLRTQISLQQQTHALWSLAKTTNPGKSKGTSYFQELREYFSVCEASKKRRQGSFFLLHLVFAFGFLHLYVFPLIVCFSCLGWIWWCFVGLDLMMLCCFSCSRFVWDLGFFIWNSSVKHSISN